jgi:hypothetical protein
VPGSVGRSPARRRISAFPCEWAVMSCHNGLSLGRDRALYRPRPQARPLRPAYNVGRRIGLGPPVDRT